MGVSSSISVTLMSDTSQKRGSAGNGHSPGVDSLTVMGFPRMSSTPPGEMCMVELDFPRASFPPGESCDLVGRIASVRVDSDWVTPLRISPQTCPNETALRVNTYHT